MTTGRINQVTQSGAPDGDDVPSPCHAHSARRATVATRRRTTPARALPRPDSPRNPRAAGSPPPSPSIPTDPPTLGGRGGPARRPTLATLRRLAPPPARPLTRRRHVGPADGKNVNLHTEGSARARTTTHAKTTFPAPNRADTARPGSEQSADTTARHRRPQHELRRRMREAKREPKNGKRSHTTPRRLDDWRTGTCNRAGSASKRWAAGNPTAAVRCTPRVSGDRQRGQIKTTNRGNAPPGRTDLRHGKMQRAVSARRWAAGNPIAAVPLADQQKEKKKHPVVHSLCGTSHPACCQTRTIHLPGALAQTGTPPNDSEGSTSRTRHAEPTSRLADRSSVRRREQHLMWSPNKKQTDRHPPPLALWEVVVMLSVTSACWFI